MNWTRRNWLQTSLSASAMVAITPGLALARDHSSELYEQAMVIDGLGFPDSGAPPNDPILSKEELDHLRQSGLTATHLTVGNVGTMPPLEAFEAIVREIARWERSIAANPDLLSSIRTAADLITAKTQASTGLIYGLQDGVSFEDDPGRLEALQHLGVRIIQPTYNRRNLLGDGCMEPSDAGLSRVGVEAIERMNALGILVDLSHCGRRTTADAIAASRRPVAFTHTGCHALVEHPRHRTDEELRAVAETGGVIGIYVMPYLSRGKQPTAADVIAHLEHAIKIAGEDHVAIGTDNAIPPVVLTEEYKENFRQGTRRRKEMGIAAPYETEEGYLFASDLNFPRRFERVADLLVERGHSTHRVEKILGANLQRLFAQSWS